MSASTLKRSLWSLFFGCVHRIGVQKFRLSIKSRQVSIWAVRRESPFKDIPLYQSTFKWLPSVLSFLFVSCQSHSSVKRPINHAHTITSSFIYNMYQIYYICFSHLNVFVMVLRKGLENFFRRKQSKFSLKSNLTPLLHLSISYFTLSSQITDCKN